MAVDEVQVKQSDDTWKTIYTGKAGDDGKTIFVQGKEAIESTQVRFVFADTNVSFRNNFDAVCQLGNERCSKTCRTEEKWW